MRRLPFLHLAATAACGLLAARLVVLPLLSERAQRGNYLWGHYALTEIYVGFPALLLALLLLALWLVPRDRRRRIGARLLVPSCAVLVALLSFDLAYALILRGAWQPDFWLDSGHIPRGDNLPDPDFGFVRTPHARWVGTLPGTERVVEYLADAQGFRNPEGVATAELVFVGDSYTEAAQIPLELCFSSLVGARTGQSTLNFGRGAYGPQQEVLVIRRYALPARPKVVIWQLFDGNDLRDAEQYAAWQAGAGSTVPLRDRYFDNSFFRPLLDQTFDSKRGLFARLLRDDGSTLPITVRYRWMPHQVSERAGGWRETGNAVRAGVAACREAGVEVVLMFLPVAAKVLRTRIEYLDTGDAAAYAPPDQGGVDDFKTSLRGLCAELTVPLIDLDAAFTAALGAGADGIYIPRDEHLDLRGHELVADAICTWLASRR